ncbi:hypothetical protein H4S14_000368 [Agrobacterium vitis]|nr:hypothetical protein [Agrobacterium vitis]MBE1436641.1 hypothetical protein [Agrobacterium vitis]
MLSLHETPADLLSHLFDYSVSPMAGIDGPLSLPSGAFMAENSLAELETRLKIDLTQGHAPAYLLARLKGIRHTQHYTPELRGLNRKIKIMQWWTPEGRNAMTRLRLQRMRMEGAEFHGDFSAHNAKRYLAYFQDFGTHIVSSLTIGDMLFQVFEVNGNLLQSLKSEFRKDDGKHLIQGALAHGLSHLTRPPWTTRASPILTTQDSDAAAYVTGHPIWTHSPEEPASLLSIASLSAPLRDTVLAHLPAHTVIGAVLANQALYLEDHRADAWSRLLRACLAQNYPHALSTGWRSRKVFQPVPFFASADLLGQNTLCPPVQAGLPDLALALDLSGPGRCQSSASETLAFFANTGPQTGGAAEWTFDAPYFMPERLIIPFVNGAVRMTDQRGQRACLVEGAWIGEGAEHRPEVVADPMQADPSLLKHRQSRLLAHLALMEQVQGPIFRPEAAAAMRRCAAWLASLSSHDATLLPLRWKAMQGAWGIGWRGPASLMARQDNLHGLSDLLDMAITLLRNRQSDQHWIEKIHLLESALATFYRNLPDYRSQEELGAENESAGLSLELCFANLMQTVTEEHHRPLAELLAAGSQFRQPPDRRHLPENLFPGDDPVTTLWNIVLTIRARHAEVEAIRLAIKGQYGEAVALVEQEIVDGRDVPEDPVRALKMSLDAQSDRFPGLDAHAKHELLRQVGTVVSLSTSACLLRWSEGIDQEHPQDIGPQQRALLIVLELLNLCCRLGLELTPLDDLASTSLLDRLCQARAETLTASDQSGFTTRYQSHPARV